MTLYEMEGFLRGKCIPGDMMVNETNAEYLVRHLNELEAYRTAQPVAYTSENALDDVSVGIASMMGPDGVVGDIPLYMKVKP